MNFYSKFLKLCESVNKKPTAVAEEAGLSRSQVTRWKQGKGFTDASAVKLANYFGIPVEELTDEKKPITARRDELEDDLQTLLDSPKRRSLLRSSKGLTEEQLAVVELVILQLRKNNETDN